MELRNIASSIFTSEKILEQLANISDFRIEIAANPKLSQRLVKRLFQDEDKKVKAAIAMNPSTPEKILLSMVDCDCSNIREAIASNKNASQKVIEKLLKNVKEEKICSLILENNHRPLQELIDMAMKNSALLSSLLSNKHLDLKILKRISNLINEEYELRPWRLASNSSTSVETLVELSKNADFYTGSHIRYLVAINPKTPAELSIEILEQLLEQEKNINFCLMEAYLNKNSFAKVSIVEKYMKYSSSKIVRLILLFHPDIAQIDFEQYSKSLHWLERYAIAQNSNTPVDIIHKLACDANKIVRAAAIDNLKNQKIYESAIG